MAKRKCPYRFPHKSRKAIIAFLSEHDSYHPINSWNGGFVLDWNIKVDSFDETGKSNPADVPPQDRFDEKWKDHLQKNDLFHEACSNGLRHYLEGEWTPWPGGEDGYKFTVNGRSGGHLVLTDWPGPKPRRWRLFPMIWNSRSDYVDWLHEDLDWEMLRRFYIAIETLDQDLTREKISAEMTYQFAWMRMQMEEEWEEAEKAAAASIEAERPDMYEK